MSRPKRRLTRFDKQCPEFRNVADDYHLALEMAETGMLDVTEADALLEETRAALDAYMERKGFPKVIRHVYETRADERVRKYVQERSGVGA